MSKVKLSQIATECRETWSGDKNNIPIVGLENLEPMEISLSSWSTDTDNTFTKKFKKGQVLLGRRRVYLKKAAIAPFDGICSGDITVIEAIPEQILPELLPFYIQNDKFFDYAIQGSAGSLSPRVKWAYLQNYEIDLPDIKNQKKLADKLWAAYKVKESYKKLLAATDEMVKSQFMEQFDKLKKTSLKELAEITMGQSPSSDSYNFDGKGVPFHQGSGEFTDKYIGEGMYCTSPTRMAKANDILISVRAPVGTVNVTLQECCIGRGLAAIRSKISSEYNEYFLYAFRAMSDVLNNMGHGSTIASINKNELCSLQMPDASLNEQMKFVRFSRQADKSKFELKKSIEAIDLVIKSLINNPEV